MKSRLAIKYPKAEIVGWNPLIMIAAPGKIEPPFTLDKSLRVSVIPGGTDKRTDLSFKDGKLNGTLWLNTLEHPEGTSQEATFKRIAKSLGWTQENITILVSGLAGKGLCLTWIAGKEMAHQLAQQLPPSSVTKQQLRALLPKLADSKACEDGQVHFALRRLVDTAPEFSGIEGYERIHKATLKAVAALNADAECHIKVDEKTTLPFIKFYKKVLDESARSLESVLQCDSEHPNPWYQKRVYIDGAAIHAGIMIKEFDDGLYFGVNPADMVAHYLKARARKSENFRCADAYAMLNHEAEHLLSHQRNQIKDPAVSKIVDFVLGLKNVRITYVGGPSVDKKRSAGSVTSGSLPHKGTIQRIELNDHSGPSVLAHECAHAAIEEVYNHRYKPCANEHDVALLVRALRADTRNLAEATDRSSMEIFRQKLLLRRKYKFDEFYYEIPAHIIEQKAVGKWDEDQQRLFPHLTAYVEKIVMPDILWHAEGKKGFVRRPESLEQLVSDEWPANTRKKTSTSWVEAAAAMKSNRSAGRLTS